MVNSIDNTTYKIPFTIKRKDLSQSIIEIALEIS